MNSAFAAIRAFARIAGAESFLSDTGATFVRIGYYVGSTSRVRGRLGSGLLLCGRVGRSLFGWCRFDYGRVASDRRLLRGFCHWLFAGGFAASVDVLIIGHKRKMLPSKRLSGSA